MARTDWYRLDNVGKFYSAQAARPRQTVFRFSATFKDDVDPVALQQALDNTLKLFPSFNVCLRSGIFWHYLEPSKERPLVRPETLPICFGLHAGPRSLLFRVTWYEQRVNLEVSHMISDGRGTYQFFTALIDFYAQARYGEIPTASILDDKGHNSDQAEDSFSKNYEKHMAASTPTERAFHLHLNRDYATPTFMEYHLPADKVHTWAKGMGVSVTSLIIACVICAIRQEMLPKERKRPIRLDVPIDLRQFFDSTTMRNFFGLAFVSYKPGNEDEPLESIAKNVQEQIKESCTLDAVKGRMNRMISLEKNIGLRFAPVFLKDLVLDLAARIAAADVTTTVSSIGRLSVPDSVRPHLESISVLTSSTSINFIACTFENDLSIGISTVYRRLDVIRNFCRIFSAAGIEGRIDMNHDKEEVDKRLREAYFEDMIKGTRKERATRKERS